MKLLVLSDLHLESAAFKPNREAVRAADVVVLAGDIHPGIDGILWAKEVFKNKPVIYVAGNHEFNGFEWESHLDSLRETARSSGIHFLENESVIIRGVRFLGCTLWTDFAYHAADYAYHVPGFLEREMYMDHANKFFIDYHGIKADAGPHGLLTPELSVRRHEASRAWLARELPLGDPSNTVVVTHHYPHKKSTAPQFVADKMTPAFGSNVPVELMLGAGLWIHGHSHSSVNYRIGDSKRQVRVMSNPRGYPYAWLKNEDENPNFKPGLLVEHLRDGSWAEPYQASKS